MTALTVADLDAAITSNLDAEDARRRRRIIRDELCPRGTGGNAYWVLRCLAISAPDQFDLAVEFERQARP